MATLNTVTKAYFKKYTGTSSDLVVGLNAVGADYSFKYRQKIAKANGIKDYYSNPMQNAKLLTLLKQGRLVRP